MKVLEDVADLQRPVNHEVLRERVPLFPQDLPEGAALDIIHDDQVVILPVQDIDDAWEVRVLQVFQDFRFRDQVLPHSLPLLIRGFLHLLDGPLFVSLLVQDKVDIGIPALPDLVEDTVPGFN